MTGPRRWKDHDSGASADVRAALRHGASQGPSEARLQAISAGVRSELEAVQEGEAARARPRTRRPGSLAKRLFALVSGAGAAAAFTWFTYPAEPRQSSMTAQPVQVAPSTMKARGNAQDGPDQGKLSIAVRPGVPRVVDAQAQREAFSNQHPDSVAPQSLTAAPAPPEPRTRSVEPVRHGSEPTELSLLQSAQRLRHDQPRQALRVLQQHEKGYPHGAFSEERDALRVELLWMLGEREAARRLGVAFFVRYPGSAYGARLRSQFEAGEGDEAAGP